MIDVALILIPLGIIIIFASIVLFDIAFIYWRC